MALQRPTEAVDSVIKRVKRVRHGVGNVANYCLRRE
jgi:hypothetical protein